MNRKIGVILSYLLMIFEILSTFLLTPFLIRTLGNAEYGVYKLIISINSYLLLLDLGVGNSIIRFLSKYKVNNNIEKTKQFMGVVTIFYLVVSVVALIIGCVLAGVFPIAFSKGLTDEEIKLAQKLLLLVTANSFFTLLTVPSFNSLMAYEKFAVSKLVSIIFIVLKIGLSFAALFLGLGSIGICVVQLICTVLSRTFFVFYSRYKLGLKVTFKGIHKKFVIEIISYSSFILLQMIATQINASLDQILIGSFVSSSAVILGVYAVGSQISQYFSSIGSAVSGVLMPGVVKMVEKDPNPNSYLKEMIKIGRISFAILGLILSVFIVNGKFFINTWAGSENSDAYYVALFLIFGNIFVLCESVGVQILWAMNAHKEQSIAKLCLVLLNIVLTIFLVRWDPLIGASLGTFISLILGDVVVSMIIFKKKLKIPLMNYFTNTYVAFICLDVFIIAFGFGINRYMPANIMGFLISCLIMVILYFIGCFFVVLNQNEKNMIKSIFIKRR